MDEDDDGGVRWWQEQGIEEFNEPAAPAQPKGDDDGSANSEG